MPCGWGLHKDARFTEGRLRSQALQRDTPEGGEDSWRTDLIEDPGPGPEPSRAITQ